MRSLILFFFNDTATTEIYTLSLHDALPIWAKLEKRATIAMPQVKQRFASKDGSVRYLFELGKEAFLDTGGTENTERKEEKIQEDRKSTRLNSSHSSISYAVFCLKKKKKNKK